MLPSFSVLDFSVKDKTWEDCGDVPEIDMKFASQLLNEIDWKQ